MSANAVFWLQLVRKLSDVMKTCRTIEIFGTFQRLKQYFVWIKNPQNGVLVLGLTSWLKDFCFQYVVL